jgi:ATP-binding protein involved in chromosome partitioning
MGQSRSDGRIPGVSHVLAVASCKGGVGKTTVAVNLALALHRGGARVGLFDADLYGPNVPLMLGIRARKTSFPMHGMRKGKTLFKFIPIARAECSPYILPVECFGLKVMSLGFWFSDTYTVWDGAFLGSHMIRQTFQDVLWGELDFLIIDLPPGTGETSQVLLKTVSIDGVLIVTTPQDLSLMDTSRSLGLFRKTGVPILGVVENMSYMICPHCNKPAETFERGQEDWPANKNIPLLGSVPLDKTLSRSIDEKHPLMQKVQDSPQAKVFRTVASKITQILAKK